MKIERNDMKILLKPFAAVVMVLFTSPLTAELPDGPGRAELDQLCAKCHEIERSVSKRQDRDGWEVTLNKMIAMGTKGTDKQFAAVLDYLVKHFPADEIPPININTASAIQIESRLSLKRSEAAAVIAYRKANGKFSSLEDLKKVEGIAFEKIEARKDRIVF